MGGKKTRGARKHIGRDQRIKGRAVVFGLARPERRERQPVSFLRLTPPRLLSLAVCLTLLPLPGVYIPLDMDVCARAFSPEYILIFKSGICFLVLLLLGILFG